MVFRNSFCPRPIDRYEAAKVQSAFEDCAGYMAQAARYQAAASALANYNATRPQFDPVQATSAVYANSYQPWKNSGTVNYGRVGGGPIGYGGGQTAVNRAASQSAPKNLTAWRMGDTLQMSDGSSASRMGNTVLGSDGTSTTKSGNTFLHSDGTTTTKHFNRYQKSDGSSVTVYGD